MANEPTKQSKNQEASQVFEKGMTSVLDFIAPSSMEIEQSHLKVGDHYAKIIFTYAYPRYLWTNWLSPIINYDADIDISMFIYPVESRIVVDNLRKKAGQIESSLRIEAEQGKVRDPQLQAVLQDIDTLRDKIQLGTGRFFQFCLYFAIYAPSKKDLDHLVDKIEGLLGSMLIYTKPATLQMEPGFNSILPINNDELFVTRNMDTSALSLSFPFTTTELTRDEGILYGVNKFNNTLVIFDRFKLENANMVVFAKAGAGKSYAVKLEALRSLMLGTEVIVIDPEDEYRELCQAVNGSYIDISLNSTKHMNPFDLPKVFEEQEEKDRLRSAIGSLHGLINIMLGKLTPEEDAIMDRALIETYNLKDINFDPETQDKTPPLLSDLEEILSNMKGAESLNQRLRKFTQGTFSGLFNNTTNIDLTNEMVVFSLKSLEGILRPVAMYMIINYIWNRVRSELKKRILVIDEAWNLMQYEDSANFIKDIAKRARKYYLGLTTITQDVEDFLVGQDGKAIINNSSLQLLLKQSPAAIDLVAGVFRLTEGEKYQLLQAEVGSGIFFAGATHVAMEIVASYMEDQLITTSPEQLLEIKKAKKAMSEEIK